MNKVGTSPIPQVTTSTSGLRIVTTTVPTAQSVSICIFAGVGSRAEEARTQGLAHFLEHMVFKGSQRRPTAIDISEAVEGAGGILNAYTAKEVTCYWDHLPYNRLELGIDVLGDMLSSPLLDQAEINRERHVVQQEIRRTHDQPSAWTGELLGRAMFGDQPLGWSTAGEEETVAALERPDFQTWLDTWYLPNNLVVSVSGNTSHSEVVELAERYLLKRPDRPTPHVRPADLDIPSQHLALEERDIAQTNLAVGFPSIPRTDPDRYALLILNSILGVGMSSRLFREVREERGLAYSIGSSLTRHSDTGVFTVSAGVSPENVSETVRVILAELEKLVDEPVGQDELVKGRDYTVGSFRLSLETPQALAQRCGENLITMGAIEPVEQVVEKLEAVDIEDVQRVATRIIQPGKATLAAVGPSLNEDELAKLIGT